MNLLAQLQGLSATPVPEAKPTRPRKSAPKYVESPKYLAKSAINRATYQQQILDALRCVATLRSGELGAVMGCTRLTAYRRLMVLEAEGQVLRHGKTIRTTWSLPK